jgi:Sulfotransferase family
MPKSPVFIVGSPRSGTSVLVIALTRAGYQGYHEGNFLPLMMSVGDMVDRYFAGAGKKNPKVLAAHVDPALLKSRLQDVFRTVTQELNTGPYWFDKSGNHEMIRAVPILRRLWPESVFIFAKRRGIENLVSRTKKFPTRDFEYHCVDWAKNMSTWREVRAQLPNDAYAEVDQRDLLLNTDAVAAKISALLQLAPAQAQTIVKTFQSARPQETEKGSAVQTYSLDSVGWSQEQLATFKKYCEAEMHAYGYGLGPEYGQPR